jgi:Ser/Thr protein kinase RdoA (MazF antagonist)
MARLHDHASSWTAPTGLTKRRYNWNGLFHDDDGTGLPARDVWPLLPKSCFEPFSIVAKKVRQIMAAWGEGPEFFGLIHADLGVDANVLFRHGEARAIDFDDSGFGYWVYDLAVSLEHCWEEHAFPKFRDALLNGYAEIRSLPEEQLNNLELFMMAFHVYWSLWAAAIVHLHPEHEQSLRSRMNRAARIVKRYVDSP